MTASANLSASRKTASSRSFALYGCSIRLSKVSAYHPLVESLNWHNEEHYLG